MEFLPASIPDVILIKPQVFQDSRGFFMEVYNQKVFNAAGISAAFVQDNHSKSAQGTLRGLHYQITHAQGKLLRVIQGEIFDVVVDLRRSSPSFGKWLGVNLSAENKEQLWVPAGFAHGFYTLSETAEVFYKSTDFYFPAGERTIRWDDPDLAIRWPEQAKHNLILSKKDMAGTYFKDAELFS